MSLGLLGTTGALSGQDLLEGLRNLRASGTLALSGPGGAVLLQVARGQVEASYKLGHYDSLEAQGQGFHLHPHEPADAPRLPSRFPESASPLLRALPRFAPPKILPPALVDLRMLLERLRGTAFNGVLSFSAEQSSAAALFLQGRIGSAAAERAGHVHLGTDAMRVLQRAGLDPEGPELELDPLDPALVRSLLGMALGRSAPSADPSTFNGLVLEAQGARFVRNGQPYLQVAGGAGGPTTRFALLEDDAAMPDLHLPDEPPGWEQQRYALTLRGLDALYPMTELAMHFRTSFGRAGQRVLEALGRGLTLEQASEQLHLDLQELKPWLKRLEDEGLVRASVG
ncbi:MAG: hypothetical protein P8Y02_01620 [Deinococcales bacterium]